MKAIEKVSLIIFANIVLILSVLLCLMAFNWFRAEDFYTLLRQALEDETTVHIMLGVCIVLILLALRCIFFDSNTKSSENSKDGILLENDNGKLLVSRDTLENLANGIVKEFDNTENITSRVLLDKENKLSILVTFSIKANAIIKDLSKNIQLKIKQTIKDSLDIDVKEVNVRIRNVASETEKGGERNGEI